MLLRIVFLRKDKDRSLCVIIVNFLDPSGSPTTFEVPQGVAQVANLLYRRLLACGRSMLHRLPCALRSTNRALRCFSRVQATVVSVAYSPCRFRSNGVGNSGRSYSCFMIQGIVCVCDQTLRGSIEDEHDGENSDEAAACSDTGLVLSWTCDSAQRRVHFSVARRRA